ncbi:hypothetical protein ACHAXT_004229 [Thalassiosira profunda]
MAPIKSFARAAFAAAAPSATQKVPAVGTASVSTTGEISSFCLEKMCNLFQAEPTDNLCLSTGGERGVRLRRPVEQGGVILSMPISSCFRDDEPPMWYERTAGEGEGAEEEHDITDYERYNPSGWASRLAASVLDLELNHGLQGDHADELTAGREIWRSMLPDKDILRASLPVHWGEEVLATSKCTALELAVDSAYFARATAVTDLAEELKRGYDTKDGEGELLQRECMEDALDIVLDMEELQRKCHDALDIVQTRACRVERSGDGGVQWGPPLRILAPVFDYINHGSGKVAGEGSANAAFQVEGERMCNLDDAELVVRATRDIAEGEEVLIDYGDSARPAWRCLTSYGFVPEYDPNAESLDEEHVENVAELWMNGLRFEVDPHSVPMDLVEVAAAQTLLDHSGDGGAMGEGEGGWGTPAAGGMLTPLVARSISKRATEASFNLITEPEISEEEDWDSPMFVHSSSLAALLRWSQHNVLLAFAENLKLFSSAPPESE